jgi:hypothetical protein
MFYSVLALLWLMLGMNVELLLCVVAAFAVAVICGLAALASALFM